MKRAISIAALALLAACGHKDGASVDAGAAPIASAPATAVATVAPAATLDAVAKASSRENEEVDAGPSTVAAGKVDGAALRKRHVERLKTDLSPVTLIKGDSALELGKRICEAVVPKRAKETPILLKPNLCGYDSVKDPKKSGGDNGVTGRTTDPEFVRGVIQCLKARGHTEITVADGCGHTHKYFEELVDIDGYRAMTSEEKVPLVAMDDDGVFDVEGTQPGKPYAITGIETSHVPTLLMPKILAETLDHGLFISIPKLKDHRYAVVSLAIKGMQGTTMYSDRSPAYQQKWRSHRELKAYLDSKKDGEDRSLYVSSLRIFAERMVDVLELETPDVTLVDGAPGEGGDGFQLMIPTAEKVAIGGTNPVLVDRVGAEFMGLWNSAALAHELGGSRTSPLIEAAARRFKLDLSSPAVEGDGAELLKSARPVHFKGMAPFKIDFDPKPGDKPPAPVALPNIAPIAALPSPPKDTGPKPEAHAVALGDGTITIDGSADDAIWKTAKPVRWDTDFSGATTGLTTSARFAWSDKALFALFEVAGTALNTDQSKPVNEERKALYNEDCVEIFFTPDPTKRNHYFEIELGPFGHFFDIEIDRDTKKQNTAWSSGLTVKAKQDATKHTAVIEASFAAPEIVSALKSGARLPLGLYRMEGKGDRKYLAWSPPKTEKPNFHVPEAFGVLVLDP